MFNSGAGLVKGDARAQAVARFESKTVFTGDTYRLTGVEYHKLWKEAVHSGETPIFVVVFRNQPSYAGGVVKIALTPRNRRPLTENIPKGVTLSPTSAHRQVTFESGGKAVTLSVIPFSELEIAR